MQCGEQVNRAQDFIWRNGRLLERQLFSYLFGSGSRCAVVSALLPYQNDDGGFGNALEPDMRCPTSQPVSTEFALQLLDRVDRFDWAIVKRVCPFLETITTPAGGLPTALTSVLEYPAAPWWAQLAQETESLNPTASIVGLLLKHGVEHPWVERASAFCWQAIEATQTDRFHQLMPAITFLEHAPDRRRADRELERIGRRLLEEEVVVLDPAAVGYVKKPLDWAPSPESYCRRLFDDELIHSHLTALADGQQPDGGWLISWEPLSPAVEMEWRSWVTIEALSTLHAYGALAR